MGHGLPDGPRASFRALSPAGLAALGGALGTSLGAVVERRGGLLLGLDGELGAGKTTLVAGALHALGIEAPVTSPTYGLVHPYAVQSAGSGKGFEALHIDLYRLRHVDELQELGLPEALAEAVPDDGAALLVEWFENARGRLGIPDVLLTLSHAEEGRIVRAQGNSPAGRELLRGLRTVAHPELIVLRGEVSC